MLPLLGCRCLLSLLLNAVVEIQTVIDQHQDAEDNAECDDLFTTLGYYSPCKRDKCTFVREHPL